MWNIYLYFIILKLFTNFQNIILLVKIVTNASLSFFTQNWWSLVLFVGWSLVHGNNLVGGNCTKKGANTQCFCPYKLGGCCWGNQIIVVFLYSSQNSLIWLNANYINDHPIISRLFIAMWASCILYRYMFCIFRLNH